MPNPWADWIAVSHSHREHLLSISEAQLITDPSDALSSPQCWGHFEGKLSLVSKIPGCWIILWHVSTRAESAAAKAACCCVWGGRTHVWVSLALALLSASCTLLFLLFSLALWSSCPVSITASKMIVTDQNSVRTEARCCTFFPSSKLRVLLPLKNKEILFGFVHAPLSFLSSFPSWMLFLPRLCALWQARWDYFVMDLISF